VDREFFLEPSQRVLQKRAEEDRYLRMGTYVGIAVVTIPILAAIVIFYFDAFGWFGFN
jgi:hypothetical protein